MIDDVVLEAILKAFGYLMLWGVLSCGITFVIAAAFFGLKEEKNLERAAKNEDFKLS
jgi:hypothetical protein